jgi:ribokinase
MGRVIVVGSANMDLIARVDRLPAAGETVRGRDLTVRPGGKGANQAVAACRLGADVVLYAAVGGDAFGRQIRDALQREGIRVEHLREIVGATTGVAMIVVAPDGENAIVVSTGANDALDPSSMGEFPARLRPDDVVAVQLEVPVETCVAAATAAHDAGATVILNAAPEPDVGAPGMAQLLRAATVLVVNESEATALASADARAGDWVAVAGSLLAYGPDACVVTLGARGAAVHDGTNGWTQPPFAVSVVDTTGAGDALCGALAAALADGASLSGAIRLGCAAGALAARQVGAQASLPTRDELERFLSGAD